MKSRITSILILGLLTSFGFNKGWAQGKPPSKKMPVIFDTDANNELDDQHALAYLLFNGNTFEVLGVTVNATSNGGDIDSHFAEAERVIKLCDLDKQILLKKGANGDFEEIEDELSNDAFDGSEAVNFIISQANSQMDSKLIVLAVGKLTNVALAVKKDSSIVNKIRLVWLGANYPEPGEYNLENDIPAMNFLLKTDLHFEMVTVRYGKTTGTDAVRMNKMEVKKMAGLGPHIQDPVEGRHGGKYNNFGDYAINLFENIKYYGDPMSRALFDMAAVAIIKNPSWAKSSSIPAPKMVNKEWVDQPSNKREIMIWENFRAEIIMKDFYNTLKNYVLVNSIINKD